LDFAELLKNRLDLSHIPFSDRRARIMFFRGRRPPAPGEPPADFFTIRLAERWEKQQGQVGHYRQRRPVVDQLVFIDAGGNPLPFELITYPHEVIFDTPAGRVRMCFFDDETLFFALPPGSIGLRFAVHALRGATDRRGGTFHGTRNVAYTVNTHLPVNDLAVVDDSTFQVTFVVENAGQTGLLINITPRLGFNRSIPEPQAALDAAATRWRAWFEAVPRVDPRFEQQYYYAWWVMRSGLISPRFYMTREGMTPSKIHYVGVWQWDAFFHALAYRHVDMKLAKDQVRLVLDHQRDDGMIPDAVHDEGIVTHLDAPVSADVTKPPIAAWTAVKLYEMSGDREFLDEIYEPLTRWNSWWFDQNDDDRDGLCQYNHPFSSGLDDSPLWDQGMPVESPDLNTYLCMQQESLARIADAIGLPDDARRWAQRADAMAQRMIERMWDADAGLFWALHAGQPIRILTPFSLYPLWTGRMPRSITDRLIAHLTDPDKFWTRFPIPTVAISDPCCDPEQMWRGPTWVNVNYLFIEGLNRSGRVDLATELRDRTLDLVMQRDDIFEYYHPQTGTPPPKAAPIFGWTSAVFIDLVIKASRGDVI
jgi:glycogen debranching enzyme